VLALSACALLAFTAGWFAHRHEHRSEQSSLWWDGWQVGRDLGMRAQRLGAGRSDE
jgi:hypothetical protein